MISVELKGNRRKTGSIEMYDLNDFVIITYSARVCTNARQHDGIQWKIKLKKTDQQSYRMLITWHE